MARAIEKGATYLDKLCHKLYDEPKGRGFQVDGKCRRCGGPLMTYYCEDRLHLIACEKCGISMVLYYGRDSERVCPILRRTCPMEQSHRNGCMKYTKMFCNDLIASTRVMAGPP